MSEIRFRSDVVVELVKHSASDEDVVWAARVSTAGERSKESVGPVTESKGLINFLMRERHGTPFEHSVFTFYVKAPIFVWREHMRHRVASYNEESGRYRVLDPEFYVPDQKRKLVQVGKAGAYHFEDGSAEQFEVTDKAFRESCEAAYIQYEKMLEAGVAREVARGVLPVTIYSTAYVTMNARALMNFLSLRKKAEDSLFPSYPQREIEMVAEKYEEHFARVMPITHEAFVTNKRVSP
ncbi:MAG: FAD-dependent thymidylate synthase [Candidatus Nanopelagicales bacterium]